MASIKTVLNPKIAYEERTCPICDTGFSVRNNKADRNQQTCSKSCSIKLQRADGWISGPAVGKDWNVRPDLRPTIRPTLHDIAWAAGIYEGEGSVARLRKNGIQVQVGQKESWLCDRLRDRFGGSVLKREMNDQPFFTWAVSGARARGFLLTIYTLMSPRRQDQIVEAVSL